MPHVHVAEGVRADRRAVYELFCKSEDFPEFMPNVVDIEIVERGDGWVESHWQTDLDGAPLEWYERDEHDDVGFVIAFHLTEGDISKFEGCWRFEPCDDGTTVVCEFDYELGVPLIEEVVGPTIQGKLEHNIQEMLRGAKARLETLGASAAELPCPSPSDSR